MGILKEFRDFRVMRKAASTNPAVIDQWRQLEQWLGVDRLPRGARSEATYFACLKILSESVGKLPLKLLQHTEKDGVAAARDHPVWWLVHDRPNPFIPSSVFWSTVEMNRNEYGNAYILIHGYGANMSLWILPNNSVQVWYDDKRMISEISDIYYLYTAPDGVVYRFGSEEIIHLRSSNTLDGFLGISVRDQLKTTILSGISSENLVNALFESGFTSKAVLQYTSNLNDESVKAFVKGLTAYTTGKMGKDLRSIIPIPLGCTLTPLNTTLGDNQFVELRKYSAQQIASAFGIKPTQIGDYTKASYASAEAQQLSFLVDTLLYILKQYEEELSYKLLTEEDRKKGLYLKFNVDSILRADFKTKVETLSKATNSFLMTPNEARQKLDLEKLEGGDKLLGNGASIPVQDTGIQYRKDTGENSQERREN